MRFIKFFILYFIIKTNAGCNESSLVNPTKERLKDMHEVINAIIVQDSILEKMYVRHPIWFCIDLKKVNLYPSPKFAEGELKTPPPPHDKYYEDLIQGIGLNGISFFLPEDTIEFKLQNKYPNLIRLDTKIVKMPNPIIYDSTLTMHKKGHHRLYEFSTPIFSKDGQKVCVYAGYYCGGLCGRGKIYYLVKNKNSWKLIHSSFTWIS